MARAAQALEAKKARKPLEQGGALEQVAARIKRVMGLTNAFSRAVRRRLEQRVSHYACYSLASRRYFSIAKSIVAATDLA